MPLFRLGHGFNSYFDITRGWNNNVLLSIPKFTILGGFQNHQKWIKMGGYYCFEHIKFVLIHPFGEVPPASPECWSVATIGQLGWYLKHAVEIPRKSENGDFDWKCHSSLVILIFSQMSLCSNSCESGCLFSSCFPLLVYTLLWGCGNFASSACSNKDQQALSVAA